MRTPKPTPEDPAVVAAREREMRRAETARTEETQALLMGATQRRLRRTGRLTGAQAASGGSVSLVAPSAVAGVGFGGGGFSSGARGGGGGGESAQFSSFESALY